MQQFQAQHASLSLCLSLSPGQFVSFTVAVIAQPSRETDMHLGEKQMDLHHQTWIHTMSNRGGNNLEKKKKENRKTENAGPYISQVNDRAINGCLLLRP